jgi:nitroimidazol reductase NimA-like FMN-containing flavoprotein (pyridoxamine 5'-phosphate oxidase superfamily)
MTVDSAARRSSAAIVRRRDRAIDDDAWIRALLRRAPMGVLATVGHGCRPFLNSNLFVYDEAQHVIYMHTARLGRTRSNVDHHEFVCFSATEMGRLLPADTALEFSVEYSGAVVFGRATIVSNEDEATRALQLLLDKYAPHLQPGRDYRPPIHEEITRTSVYRIDIDEWSGKRKAVADDFPGAFVYSPLD